MNNFLKPNIIIVDIDGTLTKDPLLIPDKYGSYRKNRDKFHESVDYYDPESLIPFPEVIKLVKSMQEQDVTPIYITAREDDEDGDVRLNTLAFLKHYNIIKDENQLLLRPYNDSRPNYEIKEELYNTYIKGRFNVLFCLDDEDKNINMFIKNKLNVLKITL